LPSIARSGAPLPVRIRRDRVSLVIRLLGTPRIERDGLAAPPPRGRKVWGLLAYVLLSDLPPTRSRAAGLLFGEADDPLGALRWSLAELRRALGDRGALQGDPLDLVFPPDADVDVLALGRADPAAVIPVDVAAGELLEGLSFPSSPVFEAWLLVARRQLAGVVQATLREAALQRLTAGDGAGATALAERLLAFDPLEPAAHELLIRCLTRRGERRAAQRQLAASEELLRRQLGAVPAELFRAAGEDEAAGGTLGDPGTALAQLEAGQAALDAGAVEPGLACLRLAAAEARACGDGRLRARALGVLGAALVHAVRSRDEEGAAVLHEALALADGNGDRAVAVAACRELGYIDVQAGRAASAGRWLARATELGRDDAERCAVLGVRGMALSDRAYYAAALDLLGQSVAAARRSDRMRQAAWSLSLVGRAHMLRGELDLAGISLDESLELVERERWTAFRPWPEALRAELDLRCGSPEAAADRTDRAFRLACQLGDPCWEGMAARVRALISAAHGDGAAAHALLADARARATRVGDSYQWMHAHILDALAGVAIEIGAPDAEAVIEALARLAARTGMRELVVRAQVHRAQLGDPRARDAARLLGSEIDNPALDRLLAPAVAP
jgi:DNA-binding SARP family transcriptional activator